MADNYKGWKLFDKVTIVAKAITYWDNKAYCWKETGESQGFIVDSTNKKQLETARKWGIIIRYNYEIVDGKLQCTGSYAITPAEYTYDNKDFTLELSESAEGSSQGGKLSFWNCWITASDGKRFLIGIAADLLLDVLKSTTVINGVVQEPLMFARCKGGVGMLCESMQSYQDALNDESARKNKSKGKTSKHKVGYVYETLTQKNVYLGDFYRWYEPIYGQKKVSYYPYHVAEQLIGFRKLDKPVVVKWFPNYYEDEPVNYYIDHFGAWNLDDKLPARKEGIQLDELPDRDKAVEKIDDNFYDAYTTLIEDQKKGIKRSNYVESRHVGLSTNKDEYTLPDATRVYLLELGYIIE